MECNRSYDSLHVEGPRGYDCNEKSKEAPLLSTSSSVDPFQQIIERVGTNGRYQFIYNIIFVMVLAMVGAMLYMNVIFALNVPEHWCTVPGREHTNFTLDEWRRITLPMRKDNRGAKRFSNCEMFVIDSLSNEEYWSMVKTNGTTQYQVEEREVTVCQNGWSYDHTWYKNTIPTDENWVCSKDLFVTNVFIVGRVTEVVGSLLLGQMGDIFGRRWVYYVSIVSCVLGRILTIVTTDSYIWFLICTSIASIGINSLFQAPQIIAMEISRDEDRSTIITYQNFGWSFGTTFMPLLFWWLQSWQPFMWYTTLPGLVLLFLSKYVVESPRWLINRRRFAEAAIQFRKIARFNKRHFEITEKELMVMFSNVEQETTYGIASLFSGWRLARNTAIMGFSWCVVAVSYFTLVLFSSRMAGNPFLNFLMQSIVEIPAYIVGKYLADKYGRRFTNSLSFFLSFLICVPIIILATDENSHIILTTLTTLIKFMNAVTFFAVNLQSIEIYPTCMRQTGIALGAILANAIGIVAPYLVYLGTTVDIRCPYYILGVLFLLGAIGATILPETLHQKLPDSMEEARHFGKHVVSTFQAKKMSSIYIGICFASLLIALCICKATLHLIPYLLTKSIYYFFIILIIDLIIIWLWPYFCSQQSFFSLPKASKLSDWNVSAKCDKRTTTNTVTSEHLTKRTQRFP